MLRLLSFCLFAASGTAVSFILLKEEKMKIIRINLALDFVKYMNEQIEYFKLPLSEILERYPKKDLFEKECSDCTVDRLPYIYEMLCNDDGTASNLIVSIMEGSYDQAINGCNALKRYLEALEETVVNNYNVQKRIKTVFPIAIGILAGLFVI